MNPDTGQYTSDERLQLFAAQQGLTRQEAAGALLGTRYPIRLEATDEEVASVSRALAAVHEQRRRREWRRAR